jgi:hypothetical protein
VVLLGDIFDLVRTDFWHRTTTPDQRPRVAISIPRPA